MISKERMAWFWPGLLILCIFLVSGASDLATPDVDIWFSKDKVAHFFVFGLLTTSILRIPFVRGRGLRGAVFAVILTIAWGGFDELRQSFTPGRNVEMADWLADASGAIVAGIAYRFWKSYRDILERPVRVGPKKARFLFRRTGP
jgi:VanZ family protein